jgi:hypothetical protein
MQADPTRDPVGDQFGDGPSSQEPEEVPGADARAVRELVPRQALVVSESFLSNRRALTSVLSKNRAVSDRFFALYGKAFMTVAEFYETVSDQVEIVDLGDLVPALSTLRQGSQPPV